MRSSYIKPISSYPHAIQNDLRLIKLDKDHHNLQIIGSQSYRKINYPSDIDALEVYQGPSRSQATQFFASRIQEMVKTLNQTPDKFFLEIKCGTDPRYADPNHPENPYDVTHPDFPRVLAQWIAQGLISTEEGLELEQLIKQDAYEKIAKMIRKHFILRWNASEIAHNLKQLPLNQSITLEQAINGLGRCNIELISVLNGKLVDESNFFIVAYQAPDGSLHYLNLPEEALINFKKYEINTLKESMKSLIHSKLEYNPLKYAKRLYSYALIIGNPELAKQTEIIINSDLGLTYQTKSEIGTILKLLENQQITELPIKVLKNQLESIKYRLASLPIFTNQELEWINQKFDYIYQADLKKERMIIAHFLDNLKSYLGQYVNNKVTQVLKQKGLLTMTGEIPEI